MSGLASAQYMKEKSGILLKRLLIYLGFNWNEPPPEDRRNLIFFILIIQGLGGLAAFNMLIMAKSYFVDYKLKDTIYAGNFLAKLGIALELPNLVFTWSNLFVKLSGDLTNRIVCTLSTQALIFALTIVLAMVDTSQWPGAFFWLTMVTAFVINAANAIFLNALFGISSTLPAKYSGAVVLGCNICGAVVALLNWAADAAGGSQRTSAIYFFLNGFLLMLVCLGTFLALPLNKFYRYHASLPQQAAAPNPSGSPLFRTIWEQSWVQNWFYQYFVSQPQQAAAPNPSGSPSFRTVWKQSWVQNYSLWLIFFVSLSVYPAVHSDIQSLSGLFGGEFVRVTCFVTYNVTALIGSITATLGDFPSRRWLWLFATVRVAFIPFFLLCNYRPRHMGKMIPRSLPVLVRNDFVYWAAAMLLGWSSGHGSALGMMYVSGGAVEPQHAPVAGMIGGAMIITGVVCGICFSYLAPTIVSLSRPISFNISFIIQYC